ncbi:MAG: hypothetical protein M1827_007385 [Pycnora praestabilis]|nr:MAG: hypothetical protein M1827_007385 [Pycnora praestabilis]
MATEPRLTTLLDDPMTLIRGLSQRTSLQLPPLYDPTPSLPSSRPLPLEPNASANKDAHASTSKLSGRGKTSQRAKSDLVTPVGKAPSSQNGGSEQSTKGRKTGHVPVAKMVSLQVGDEGILGDEAFQRPQDSRLPKRRRLDESTGLGDFVKLPKPAPKGRKPPPPLPALAVLNALHAPPPTAALFPPIASGAFHDAHGRNTLNGAAPISEELELDALPPNVKSASTVKASKKQSTKPRRKWSDKETDELLQGVAMFGVGNWKKILSYPKFTFTGRSSIDLKDRFRTCCPADYRDHLKSASPNSMNTQSTKSSPPTNNSSAKSLPSLQLQTSLSSSSPPTTFLSLPASPIKIRKSRSHRRNTEDLARLGIEGPFPKAKRRERRTFSEEEDANLLRGYMLYGPAWSRIQSDQTFKLETRRATDLRDRFRNRYPEKYAEAGFKTRPNCPSKEYPPGTTSADQMSGSSSGSSLVDIATLTNGSQDQDEGQQEKIVPDIDTSNEDTNPMSIANSLFDWGENTLPPFANVGVGVGGGGEPDIQRILLDHIHPLATFNPARSSLNLNPMKVTQLTNNSHSKPPNSHGNSNSISSHGLPSSQSSSIHPNIHNHNHNPTQTPYHVQDSQKLPFNLPPPTDLLPLDFDSTSSFHFPVRGGGGGGGGGEIGERRGRMDEAVGSAGGMGGPLGVGMGPGLGGGLEEQGAGDLWEDMATHIY